MRSKSDKVNPWERGIIQLAIVVIVLLVVCATSCSPKWWQKWCKWNVRDSVAVHYKDSTIFKDSLRIRDSLMYVPIPIEGSQNIFPTIMPSHLETSLAESDAFVDSLGLHHSLKNKKGDLGVHVPVTEHTTTTEHTSQKDSIRVEYVEVPVEVEKPLSKWKSAQIRAFWWLLGGLALCLLWIFRKPILKLIKP